MRSPRREWRYASPSTFAALSSENLHQVQIFCILRDGVHWPEGSDKNDVWMTPDQEKAVVGFVENGGALLGLHNCLGLYPAGGQYLDVLGGTYNGHGPLERFRVRVHDTGHPIARGVEAYEVADEQHTPVPSPGKVNIFSPVSSQTTATSAAQGACCVCTSRGAPVPGSIRKHSTQSASWLATSTYLPLGSVVRFRAFEWAASACRLENVSCPSSEATENTATLWWTRQT